VVAAFCETGNELPGFIDGRKFIDHQSDRTYSSTLHNEVS
jgi:hypothetical protein